MATPNGVLPATPSSRKRMIQPVLPALPVQRKPRKNVDVFKEPVQGAINDPAERHPPSPKALVNGSNHLELISSHTAVDEGPSSQSEQQEKSLVERTTVTPTQGGVDNDVSNLMPNTNSLSDSSQPIHKDTTAEAESQSAPEPPTDTDLLHTLNRDAVTTSAPEQLSDIHGPLLDDLVNGHILETEEKIEDDFEAGAYVNGQISPLTNGSHDKNPVESSGQATPIIAGIEAVSPESTYPSNPPVMRNSDFRELPQTIPNGHVSPIPPPGLHRPHMSVSSSTMSNHFPGLFEHISQLAFTKEWADWSLEINQPVANNPVYVCYAHGFALVRSDRMKKIIARTPPSYPASVISLYPSKFIVPHAFEAAVRFLYTDNILTADSLFPPNALLDFEARAQRIDYVLSYWVSGLHLGIEPIVTCSYNIVAGAIDWDIAELLVKEAMAIRTFYRPIRELETPPDYYSMADSIMQLVFGLYTKRLNLIHVQLKLDPEAQPTTMTARFGKLESGKLPTNPALAGMVFGTMPSTENFSPTSPAGVPSSLPTDSIASSILLNLDFADFEALSVELIRSHGNEGLRVISEAVQERERRRLHFVNNRAVPNSQRMANSVSWDSVGVREMIEEGKLRRERVGYLLSRKR